MSTELPSSITDSMRSEEEDDWNIQDWLKEVGLDEYIPAFVEHEIDYDALCELSERDLTRMGITKVGIRKKLLRAIEELAEEDDEDEDDDEDGDSEDEDDQDEDDEDAEDESEDEDLALHTQLSTVSLAVEDSLLAAAGQWTPSPRPSSNISQQSTAAPTLSPQVATALVSRTATVCSWQDLEHPSFIGRGSFGEVHRAVLWGTDVAVKTILSSDEKARLEFEQEASLLSSIRHPNIVLFMATIVNPPKFCIVTEFVSKGNLLCLLHDIPEQFTFERVVRLALGIARGMLFLHQLTPAVIHRDLKSPNVLVDDHWNAKVADFGLSKVKEASTVDTVCGSPAWMAPEVLRNDDGYSEKCDTYSFGVVVWEMITKQMPHTGMIPVQIIAAKLANSDAAQLRIPDDCNPDLAQLVRDCLLRNPCDRPTFSEIVQRLRTLSSETLQSL